MNQRLSEKALRRRTKRYFNVGVHDYYIPCQIGLSTILLDEVKNLPGLVRVSGHRGGIGFSGPIDLMYSANLHIRSGHRVLIRIDSFLAQSFPMLFNKVKQLPWEIYFGSSQAYNFSISSKESRLNLKSRISSTIASGIEARLMSLGLHEKHVPKCSLQILVRFFQDTCTISMNTSGDHLHKRGYRITSSVAPIRETMAAAVMLLANSWNHDLVIDPFSGSGSLLIEGFMIAESRPPGIDRDFAFRSAPFFSQGKWNYIKRMAKEKEVQTRSKFIGIDTSTLARNTAQRCIQAFNNHSSVTFRQGDARQLNYRGLIGGSARPLIVSNLPYGKRIGNSNSVPTLLLTFFRKIRQELPGCHYAFITKHPGLLTQAGIPPEKTLHSSNGGLAVTIALGKIPERS